MTRSRKVFRLVVLLAFIMTAPGFVTGSGVVSGTLVSPTELCAEEAGSCMPKELWDCIHGDIHLTNRCDPACCELNCGSEGGGGPSPTPAP
jgi:hypothetical protein